MKLNYYEICKFYLFSQTVAFGWQHWNLQSNIEINQLFSSNLEIKDANTLLYSKIILESKAAQNFTEL